MAERTPYTLRDIDDAVRAIFGEAVGDARLANANRVLAMKDAAAHSWIDQRAEDRHSAVLRQGLIDLKTGGCLLPIGGDSEWANEP